MRINATPFRTGSGFGVLLSASLGERVLSVPVIWTAKDLEGPDASTTVQGLFENAVNTLQDVVDLDAGHD